MVAQKQNRIVALPTTHSVTPSNRLAALQQSEHWKQLPRPVQRSHEAHENRISTLVHAFERRGQAITDLRVQLQDDVGASSRAWQSFIDELGDAVSEEERQALIIQKSNELAALLTSHQAGMDTLNALMQAQLEEVLTRPAHEWTKRTLQDKLESLFTFGEAELERRGYPPLSFWQSVLNIPTLGAVVDYQLREYERARLLPQVGTSAADVADGEEGVIDVDFTPR